MKRLLDALLDALFPDHYCCCFCGAEARLTPRFACPVCEKELRSCAVLPALDGIDGLFARYVFDNVTSRAIHRLKYSDAQFLAKQLLSGYELPSSLVFDAVVAVPLHRAQRKKRGYNQSELIADILATNAKTPRLPLLSRTRNTKSQTTLNQTQRAQNVSGAFLAAKRCDDMSILLVDDVITTGSTAKECARALKAAGAKRVYAFGVCIHPKLIG